MKNLKIIALLTVGFLFSLSAYSQSFSSFGTYSGTLPDGKAIAFELEANTEAELEIDGTVEDFTNYTFDPSVSDIIVFNVNGNTPGSFSTQAEGMITPRRGILTYVGNDKWELVLPPYTTAVILDYIPSVKP